MPTWNEQRDVCVIFSGEDFSDPDEAMSIRSKGHHFTPENANYLVHSYEESGDEFVGKLNGRFSGVIIDLRQRKMALFNDRYGLSRIYFYEKDGSFYFSSEAKSLLKIFPELRRLNYQ